ncbi:MAG: O-antigen ligase domain-containing protein [Alteromonadaceae bacterium]|nr:O-antigen ligase domain-containing protein [Alteromonadaceae bacterium]
MATQINHQSYLEERIVFTTLTGTYPIYLLGSLYLVGCVLGWLLLGILLTRWFIEGKRKTDFVPAVVWLWIISMFAMLVILWIGHADWGLGTAKTIKSSIGWAKGWALMALFMFLGAVAPIRYETIIRAVCILSKHTLIFSIITLFAYVVRIPGDIYVSPLQFIGGPGPSFFTVSLYGLNPETGGGRWQFYGPWAPAAGLLACLGLVMCLHEKDPKFRKWGVFGCAVMVLLSQSRAGWVIFVMLFPMVLLADKFKEPWFLLTAGILIPALLILGMPVYEFVMDSYEQIKQARPASTRVRAALENIAWQRWQAEAYWFGHGIVERGPKLVEGMPIGSHHSWYGLLFVKGLTGLLALAIPMFVTIVYLFWQSQTSKLAHCALCMMAVFVCYSFFENLEILSYLYWPALLIIGMALNPANPNHAKSG